MWNIKPHYGSHDKYPYSKSIPRLVHSSLSPLPLLQSKPYFLSHLQLSALLLAPYTRALTVFLPCTRWGKHSPTSKSGDQISGTGQFVLRPFGGMRTWVTEPEGAHAPCCLPGARSAHTFPHQLFPIKFLSSQRILKQTARFNQTPISLKSWLIVSS